MLLIHAVFKNDLWSLLLKIHFKNKEKIKLSPIEEGKPSLRKGSDNYPNSTKTNGREQHPPKEKLPAKKTILHTKENIDFNLTYNQIELAELRSLASVSLLTASAKSFENKLARAEHLLSLARTFLFNITLISNQVMASLPVIFLLAFEISLSVRGLVLYIRTRYINSIFVVALRQLQVWSQVIFILIVMWNQTAVGRTSEPSITKQKTCIWLIIISLLAQYTLIILHLILFGYRSLKQFIDVRKLKKTTSKNKQIEEEHTFLRYSKLSETSFHHEASVWTFKRSKNHISPIITSTLDRFQSLAGNTVDYQKLVTQEREKSARLDDSSVLLRKLENKTLLPPLSRFSRGNQEKSVSNSLHNSLMRKGLGYSRAHESSHYQFGEKIVIHSKAEKNTVTQQPLPL